MLEDLRQGTSLMTLCGPSGIGKTRLAKQVWEELRGEFDGAWFCSLFAAQGLVSAEATIAQELGFQGKHGEELIRALGRRGRSLLVLDNLDAIAAALSGVLEEMIDGCPQLQILATSILPIGIPGEARFDLGPLEAEDAVALYLERARRASANKVFSKKEEGEVEELVGRLDRIPLAIELAAARVHVLPPRVLLSRIAERFELLRSQMEGRHGSLLNALTLTWDLLSAEEQAALMRASVFEGGFTLEAAVELIGLGDEAATLHVLEGLRAKALVQAEGQDTTFRFFLFESIREFAEAKLSASGMSAALLAQHASYYVERGVARAEQLEGPEELQAIGWLRAERENLSAAFRRHLDEDPELAARAGWAICTLFAVEEPTSPSTLRAIERTLEAARRSGRPHLIASALGNHASAIMRHRPLFTQAHQELEEALSLVGAERDRSLKGDLLVRVGTVLWMANDWETTETTLQQALKIGEEEQDALLQVRALLGLGALETHWQRFDEVDRIFRRVESLTRAHGLWRYERLSLVWIASVWLRQRRFREARGALQLALPKLREVLDRPAEANALNNLGCVEMGAGQLEEAESSFAEALTIYREVGNRRGEGLVYGNLAHIALLRGDSELAERHFLESLSAHHEGSPENAQVELLPFLAVAEARQGRTHEARRTLDEARSFFAKVQDKASLDLCDLVEGTLELATARRLGPERWEEREALVRRARERIEAAQALASSGHHGLGDGIRFLLEDLEETEKESFGEQEAASPKAETLVVGPDGAWFELAGHGRIELRGRSALRQLLETLAVGRLQSPGKALSAHALFEAGWPGTEIHPNSAASRVYVAIWRLRDAGLSEILLKETDGYLLDPTVPLERSSG